jgi:hypothetical protein
MYTIKINGDDNEILSVTLKDVLSCIDQGEKVIWGILWLDVTINLRVDGSIADSDYDINRSETATIVTWEQLTELSSQINQAINLLIIGDKTKSDIIKYSTDEEMYKNCDYTIELIDSSYWIIHSKNDFFIKNIFGKLQGVEYDNS